MSKIRFSTRAFNIPIPGRVLAQAQRLDHAVLNALVKKQRLDLPHLAKKTGVPYESLEKLLAGEAAPLGTRGSWTKAAIALSRALWLEPGVLFQDTFDRVQSELGVPEDATLRLTIYNEYYRR
ncbi:MAG: hypothetical protein WC529_02195 [Candidatus Margulisiibacteriota bacterium]